MSVVDVQLYSSLLSNTAGSLGSQYNVATGFNVTTAWEPRMPNYYTKSRNQGPIRRHFSSPTPSTADRKGAGLTKQGKVTFLFSQERNSSAVDIGVDEAGGL